MKPGASWLYRLPFYPALVAIYAVLYLWQANYYQAPAFVVVEPLSLALGVTALAGLLNGLIFRQVRKAAAATGLCAVLIFFYGHAFNLVLGWQIFGLTIGRPALLLVPLWGLLLAGGGVWIWRTRSNLLVLTWGLNLVTGFLLLMTLGQLGWQAFARIHPAPAGGSQAAALPLASRPAPDAQAPDVYYIVLDGYDREDLFKEDTGQDNHAFIAQLEQLGFVVPECTQSNYNTTVFAVASTFQMNYLDRLGFSYAQLAQALYGIEMSTPELEAAIQTNPVMSEFQNMGYQVVTFRQSYPFIDFPSSDIIYDDSAGSLPRLQSLRFRTLFLQTTLLQRLMYETETHPAAFDGWPAWALELLNPDISFTHKYQQDLYQLNQLDQVVQLPGKKFLYAHLMVTHPDFAFTTSGEFRVRADETLAAYADQVTYANGRILALVKNILAQSQTPPVIILQGDHGYGFGGRGERQFKILNAYYLPQNGAAGLYPAITPVNTFRLILSTYFGKSYPLLDDQSVWVSSNFQGGYQAEAGSCVTK